MNLFVRKVLFLVVLFLLTSPSVWAQEILLTPPDPNNSQIQKASTGAAFGQGWNYFSVGFDCTTLTVLSELQADGGSALNVDAVFVKNFFNWETYTFQSVKHKKVGSSDLLAFNSNQKFFLQIDEKACSNPDAARQAQINKVREGTTAKNNFLDQVKELPVDLWTKLTRILENEGPEPSLQTDTSKTLDNLTIGGKTTVNDLGVTGKITAGLLSLDGLDSSITSLSDIKFNLPAGKVEIDRNGNLKIQKLLIDENSDSIGSTTLQSGATFVDISTSAVTQNSKIFITPTSETGGQSLIVKSKTAGRGFRVIIEKSYSSNITFDWLVIN